MKKTNNGKVLPLTLEDSKLLGDCVNSPVGIAYGSKISGMSCLADMVDNLIKNDYEEFDFYDTITYLNRTKLVSFSIYQCLPEYSAEGEVLYIPITSLVDYARQYRFVDPSCRQYLQDH